MNPKCEHHHLDLHPTGISCIVRISLIYTPQRPHQPGFRRKRSKNLSGLIGIRGGLGRGDSQGLRPQSQFHLCHVGDVEEEKFGQYHRRRAGVALRGDFAGSVVALGRGFDAERTTKIGTNQKPHSGVEGDA